MDNRRLFGDMCELSFRMQYEAELRECTDISEACTPDRDQRIHRIITASASGKRFLSKRLIAILVAAIILLLSACTALLYAKEIGCFFASFNEEHIRVNSLEGEVPRRYRIESIYELRYIPAGYKKTLEEEKPSYIYYEWMNDQGELIVFRQKVRWESIDFTFNNTQVIETFHFEFEVHHFEEGEHYFWFWQKDGYYFLIETNAETDDAEIQRMIAGVVGKDF